MHNLKYLPWAVKDLRDITSYIADNLKAPQAAMDLLDAFDKSILRLQEFPYSCKVFHPLEALETEYRVLPVNSYLVFYVVKEQDVEIHRIIYAKMELGKIMKGSLYYIL